MKLKEPDLTENEKRNTMQSHCSYKNSLPSSDDAVVTPSNPADLPDFKGKQTNFFKGKQIYFAKHINFYMDIFLKYRKKYIAVKLVSKLLLAVH